MKLSGRGGRPSEAGADGGMGRSTIAGAFAVTAGRALRLHLETVIQILYMYREQADESERL